MLRRLALVIAVASAVVGAAFVVLQMFPTAQYLHRGLAMLAAFTPYGVLVWLLVIALVLAAARGRARLWAIPAALLALLQLVWAWGYLPGPAPAAEGSPLRVASFNTYFGQADPDATAAQLSASDPDVIVLLEVGEEFIETPAMAALLDGYPHRGGLPTPRGATPINTLVAAREPLELIGRSAWTANHLVLGTTTADGEPVTLIAAHPSNMMQGVAKWRREATQLTDDVATHIDEPLLVIGDMNTTREGATYREITAPGLVNAAQQAGAGWQPTFSGSRRLPALIAIDHALVNDQVAASHFETFAVPGSDHRGIIVDVTVRPAG
ncbi:endonuclease/exonuclease/phosphatase family protein [Propioniciclava soli]|uniref:Endonuclease/exonuclease/phosphatase family protein n=1 Tax=Propioniciclava soli TaxID=2775081 RepID=A0ABZ3C3U7_9ACTN